MSDGDHSDQPLDMRLSQEGGTHTPSSCTAADLQRHGDVEQQYQDTSKESPGNTKRDESDEEAIAQSQRQEGEFPEGGLEAWLCVAGTFTVMAFSFGYLNAYGIFQEYYTSNFLQAYSQSDIAWIGAMQYFFIFGVGLFAGRAFDLGLFKPLMAFAIFLTTFCQMMLSLCTKYYQIFLAQGVGLGISFGLLFNLAVSVPTHWFQRRRATALGIQAAGSSLGGVIFPILIRHLLSEIGYGWTMRLIGFGCIIFLGASYFVMKTRLPPIQDIHNGGWRKVTWFDPSAFRDWSYTCFVIGCTLCLFGLYTPFVYMDTFTSTYNIPGDGYWLSILNAASIFGRVIPGFVADRLGRINTLFPHTALAGILLFIFPVFTNLSIIVFVLIYGYCSGCFVSVIAPAAAQLGPTSTVGTRLGMMFAFMSIGGLLGTPISGFILGNAAPFKWWATAGYSAACVTSGVVFLAISRQFALKGRFRGTI